MRSPIEGARGMSELSERETGCLVALFTFVGTGTVLIVIVLRLYRMGW